MRVFILKFPLFLSASSPYRDPSNARFRSLNGAKLLPRLTSPSLAGWYILRHAGFVK